VKKFTVKREGKNTVYRFRTLFKDLPLKYQNVIVKIPKFLLFTDFQISPSRPSLKVGHSIIFVLTASAC
jgi:hypothetical protein